MYSISFMCNDDVLIAKFKLIENFNCKPKVSNFDSLTNTDICIISDDVIEINELINKRNAELKNIKHVFYLIRNENKNRSSIKDILRIKNIFMINKEQTHKQIIEEICKLTIKDYGIDKNVVVFYGADNKVGVTQIAQSVAQRLADRTEHKVFLGFFNGYPGLDYMQNKYNNGSSIDSLRVKLANEILTKEEIFEVCSKRGNLYIMEGINNIMERRYYHPDHIEYLVNILAAEFDVVIIDAGSDIEQGISIGSLKSTNNRFLVTTQQQTALETYNRKYSQILSGLDIKNPMIIVNKYIIDPILDEAYKVAKLYKGTLVDNLPYIQWGLQSEKDKVCLLEYKNKEFNRGIESLARTITAHLRLDYPVENHRKKLGLFNFLV